MSLPTTPVGDFQNGRGLSELCPDNANSFIYTTEFREKLI
jgi:hypothetical protein